MTFQLMRDSAHGLYRLADCRGRPVREANKFLQAIATRMLSKHTVRAYGYDLLACFRWLGSVQKIRELTAAQLLEFIRHQKEKLSPRSINRQLSTIQLFYRFVTGKTIPRGPGAMLPAAHYRGRGRDRILGLHRIETPSELRMRVKVPNTLVQPLTVDQVRSLIAQFVRYRDIAILYLMLLCGLRSQEVREVKNIDILFQEKTVRVHGKGNKERLLPLPDVLAAVIRQYLLLERPNLCPSEALFVVLQGKHRGEAMSAPGLRSLFRVRRSKPGLQQANPHRLRHTFGASMARQGMSLPVLQRLMGHAHAPMTLQYINLSMTDLSEEFHRASSLIAARYLK